MIGKEERKNTKTLPKNKESTRIEKISTGAKSAAIKGWKKTHDVEFSRRNSYKMRDARALVKVFFLEKMCFFFFNFNVEVNSRRTLFSFPTF